MTQVQTIMTDLLLGETISVRKYEEAPYRYNHPPIRKAVLRLADQGVKVIRYPRLNINTNKQYFVWKIKECK